MLELKKEYQTNVNSQRKEVRNMVLEGIAQIKEGKTKDFDKVCDRLEKKYSK